MWALVCRRWVLRGTGSCPDWWPQTELRHHCDGVSHLLLWPKQVLDALVAALRHRGVLVRPMTGKPLLEGSGRVGIGGRARMQLFRERYRQCAAVSSL